MLIGQWREYFIFVKQAKLLAHDWSSGCLATAYSIEKLFFCKSFEMVYEEYIEQLKDKSENENTKNGTEWWKNVSKKWATERNLQANLEEYENDVLDQRSIVAVLVSIQKFSNFALHVINK